MLEVNRNHQNNILVVLDATPTITPTADMTLVTHFKEEEVGFEPKFGTNNNDSSHWDSCDDKDTRYQN